MLSLRPLVSSALALLGLAATLGFAPSARATASLTISTPKTLGADQRLDELTIESGGVLIVEPRRSGGSGAIHIRARKITVKAGGSITASNAGYLGVNGNDGDAAPGSDGGGKRSSIAGQPGGGGGYISAGASGTDDKCMALPEAKGGVAFATPTAAAPILGSAGGAANVTNVGNAGGDGGGVIILEAAEIVIDGSVEARGESPLQVSGVGRGGGSGGFIAITAAHLQGTGVISVAGGNGPAALGAGPIPPSNGGGGAGGVILIHAGDVAQTLQDKLDLKGGTTGMCPLGANEGKQVVDIDAAFCVDADGDMHTSTACGGDDCDDSDAAIHPGVKEACNSADDNCDGVNNEGDGLCPAGSTCDATAKTCLEISDAGSDAGPVVDAGALPDYIAFESGCSLRGSSDGPGALALVSLGLGALVTRRRRASRLEKARR